MIDDFSVKMPFRLDSEEKCKDFLSYFQLSKHVNCSPVIVGSVAPPSNPIECQIAIDAIREITEHCPRKYPK